MEPVTIIVAALAAGAAAALKSTAEQAIKDAYAGFKALIQRKYGITSVEGLERKPDSEAKQTSVTEDLTEAGAGDDQELLDQAKALLDAIKAHDRAAAAKINVNLDEIEAAYFKLKDAAAEGDVNIGVKKGAFSGGIGMEGLTVGTLRKKREIPSVLELAPSPVLLGVSAPSKVQPGEEFTVRFVAYLQEFESQVDRILRGLSPRSKSHLGMWWCRWQEGVQVTVILSCQYLDIAEPQQEFE